MIMFVIDSYGIKPPRRLSAKAKAANQKSIKKLKAKWDSFDDEARMRATKTIRCLTTQEAYR
jgi:hypothetical protein